MKMKIVISARLIGEPTGIGADPVDLLALLLPSHTEGETEQTYEEFLDQVADIINNEWPHLETNIDD